jgi:hypothetical protein
MSIYKKNEIYKEVIFSSVTSLACFFALGKKAINDFWVMDGRP